MSKHSVVCTLLTLILILLGLQLLLLRVHPLPADYDFADNFTSDVDASVDKGSHSNFTAQQYGPDSIFDNLTEDNGNTAVVDPV